MLGKLNWILQGVSSLALKIESCVHLEKLRTIEGMTTFFLWISHCTKQLTKVGIFSTNFDKLRSLGVLCLILTYLFFEKFQKNWNCFTNWKQRNFLKEKKCKFKYLRILIFLSFVPIQTLLIIFIYIFFVIGLAMRLYVQGCL
jgi:hypothetical protein